MYADLSDSASPVPLLQVGTRINAKGKLGTIRFVGSTQFETGQWVGIELDLPQGKNDGSVRGVQYFTCEKQSPDGAYGLFVRPNILKPVSASRNPSAGSSVSSSPTLSAGSPRLVRIYVYNVLTTG